MIETTASGTKDQRMKAHTTATVLLLALLLHEAATDAAKFEKPINPVPFADLSATIQQSWQNLLLRAAQEQDESDVIPGPEQTVTGIPVAHVAEVLPFAPLGSARHGDGDSGLHRSATLTKESAAMSDDVEHLMSLVGVTDLAEIDVEGDVLREKGNAELLAQTGAYVARLATLIADSLGLEPFEQLHAKTAQVQCAVRVERQTIVALRADRRADLTRFLRTASP